MGIAEAGSPRLRDRPPSRSSEQGERRLSFLEGTMRRTPILPALALLVATVLPGAASAEGERGELLFNYCVQCHGEDAGGTPAIQAPAIAGLPQWYLEGQLVKFRSGLRGNHPADEAGMRMRPMSLTLVSDEDVKSVAAYVASLPPTLPEPTLQGGDASRGKVTYDTICIACHGPGAVGNQQLNAPPTFGAHDWYLLSQLKKFKAGVRGGDPADVNALLMRPMALQLADEQAMLDVIAHIKSLAR
jgi:cytochrome c553